jgi:flagellar motor component MotA
MPSVLIVTGGSLGMYLFSGSPVVLLVRSGFSSDLAQSELPMAIKSWKRLRRFIMAIGWVSFLIGLIALLHHMPDAIDSLGPGFATALITLFYSSVLSYVVCLPIQLHLDDSLS